MHVVYAVVRRESLKDVVCMIKKCNPKAFYSIEDIRFVNEGVFPCKRPARKNVLRRIFRPHRKGK